MLKIDYSGEKRFYFGLKELEKYLDFAVDGDGVVLCSEKTAKTNIGFRTENCKVVISYSEDHDFFHMFMRFYAFYGIKQNDAPVYEVNDFGVMVDCSRNGVWNVRSVKDCIVYLALMGYGYLELYTEDTYEINGEPYFGYMRGRFSTQEIKEIDDYARSFGIELIPCIQTLAHLGTIFRWNGFKEINDVDDILLLRDEKTYSFIDKMFRSVAEMFSSRRINIGMDEAMLLGSGRFLNINGYVPRSELMLEHLSRVVEIAGKYGFQVSLWNDMFFRADNGNEYRVKNPVFSEKTLSMIPPNVKLIYWDYVSEDAGIYDDMLKSSKRLCKNTGFAGGLFSWQSFVCDNDLAMRKIVPAVNACRKNDIKDLTVTTWGDDGAEASRFSCLPTLCAFSDYLYNGKFELCDKILKSLFNYGFREFCDVSLVNRYVELKDIKGSNVFYGNTAKYMLYNDLFLGLMDNNIPPNAQMLSKRNYLRLKELAGRKSSVSYLFKTLCSLSETLIYKADLSVKIKEHYDKKDIDGLKEDIKTIGKVRKSLRRFINNYREQWQKENKPFGFEVQQIRLGGLLERIDYAASELKKYVDGEKDAIEELEQPRLAGNYVDGNYRYNVIVDLWKQIVTCGKI